MRIINDKPNVAECWECKVRLEYEDSDIQVGAYGCAYIKCPKCGELIFLDKAEYGLTLTVDNIRFPQHFYKTHSYVYELSDESTMELIKGCLQSLEDPNNECGRCSYSAIGDTVVFISQFEDEYSIYVAKGYYLSSIPR